uniref:Putative vacuolar protein sorting 37b n=1 Tax=Anopheles triannulatus TaxID=58253 RepID=A0A2M4AR49_9DIPT
MYQPILNQAIQSLQSLSSEELRNLLGDDDMLDERVNEAVQSMEASKETVLSENRSLAEANLSHEPKMIELRSRVQELSEEGRKLGASVNEKVNELKSNSNKTNPETLLALLQTAAAETEEETEQLAKQFLDNDFTVEVFLEKFMGLRKLMHLRKLKAEKMTELLQRRISSANSHVPPAGPSSYVQPFTGSPFSSPLQRNSGAASTFYLPPPSMAGPQPTGAVPYPVGLPPMPMPMPMFRPPGNY